MNSPHHCSCCPISPAWSDPTHNVHCACTPAEQPTDWIKDAGWFGSLRTVAREGTSAEFDAMLRRLLFEHADSAARAAERALAERVEAFLVKWWGDLDDPRARDLSRILGHSDPYCIPHCRPGVKHSQCGCSCDHSLRAALRPEAATTEGAVALSDRRPHSRACGIRKHDHGSSCSPDCPTCHRGTDWSCVCRNREFPGHVCPKDRPKHLRGDPDVDAYMAGRTDARGNPTPAAAVHPDTEGEVGVVLRCECGHAQRDHRHDHGRCEERDRGTWCGCEAYRPRPVPDRAALGEGEPT